MLNNNQDLPLIVTRGSRGPHPSVCLSSHLGRTPSCPPVPTLQPLPQGRREETGNGGLPSLICNSEIQEKHRNKSFFRWHPTLNLNRGEVFFIAFAPFSVEIQTSHNRNVNAFDPVRQPRTPRGKLHNLWYTHHNTFRNWENFSIWNHIWLFRVW